MTKFILAIAAAVLLASCGGGGGGDSGGAAPVVPPPAAGGDIGGNNGDGGNDGDTGDPGDTTPYQPGPAASIVIGQPGMDTRLPGTSATRMRGPTSVAVAGNGYVFIADPMNNRVLAYPPAPIGSEARAAFALGQPSGANNLTSSISPGVSRETMKAPMGVSVFDTMLVVADTGHNRVLVWFTLPTDPSALPNLVVGQTAWNRDTPACGSGMSSPHAVHVSSPGRLVVADTGNHRAMVWTTAPGQIGEAPTFVLGQPNTATCTEPVLASAANMHRPTGIWSNGDRTVVTSSTWNRALVWGMVNSNNQPAAVVLGQEQLDDRTAANDDDQDRAMDGGPTNRTLNAGPSGLAVTSDGARLVLSDSMNHRVLVWNTFPTLAFQPADAVLGQGDFLHGTAMDKDGDGTVDEDGLPGPRTLFHPRGVALENGRLFVSDESNARVLVFAVP